MSKELEFINNLLDCYGDVDFLEMEMPKEELLKIRQALLELKTIKEANSSEALEIIRKYASSNFLKVWHPEFVEALKTIVNYVLKAQEQEEDTIHYKETIANLRRDSALLKDIKNEQGKVLEIIREKNVDTYILKMSKDYREYNKKCFFYLVRSELIQEEFELLKRYFG